MNKKTFTLALVFLVLTLVWLGTNVYWKFTHSNCVHAFDFIIGILFEKIVRFLERRFTGWQETVQQ